MKRRLVVFVLDNYKLFRDELSQSTATMNQCYGTRHLIPQNIREKFQEYMRKRRDTAMGGWGMGDGRVIQK